MAFIEQHPIQAAVNRILWRYRYRGEAEAAIELPKAQVGDTGSNGNAAQSITESKRKILNPRNRAGDDIRSGEATRTFDEDIAANGVSAAAKERDRRFGDGMARVRGRELRDANGNLLPIS